MTTEPNNVKKLQQRNYNLVVENEFLKDENNRLNEICIYWEREHDVLADENSKLFNRDLELQDNINEKLKIINDLVEENTQLKHKNKAQAKTIDRLINIITDEHYN